MPCKHPVMDRGHTCAQCAQKDRMALRLLLQTSQDLMWKLDKHYGAHPVWAEEMNALRRAIQLQET